MSIILGMQKKVERMKKAIKLTHEVYNLLETMGVKKYETYNVIIKRTVQHYLSCQVGKKSTTTGSG